MQRTIWHINTSNPGKLREFERLFQEHGEELLATAVDLKEIHADPITVVVHKASQLEDGVIVDDTILDIEGAEVGIAVRWVLEHLSRYAGSKTCWRVLLAYKEEGLVHVYEGKVHGTVVHPRGKSGFGFDPIFLPKGSEHTLAEAKPNSVNARAIAVAALLNHQPIAILPVIREWKGKWQ